MGCPYCNKPFTEELWCNECDTCITEGWTSGNQNIDEFIKDTMYNARDKKGKNVFLEWVSFDRFTNIKQIGQGGFAKVFSATWLDGKLFYNNGRLKSNSGPIKVALKRLDGSQNMSEKYLNEV
jgi:serine/threonine protein kinase